MSIEHFNNENNFEKKKVVITGGTEGIGRAIALELSSQNQEVVICARTKERLESIVKENANISAYEVDLANHGDAHDFVQDAITEMEGLDLLILNAAIPGVPRQGETEAQAEERRRAIIKVNEVAQVALTHSAAAELKKNNGVVVFMTSGLARRALPGAEEYGKSKKRVEEFLDEFMKRPENKGIHYFSVSPGAVDTRMHEEIAQFGPPALASMSKVGKAAGRLSNPAIIGKIIAKMSVGRKKFNSKTKKYDLPIQDGEIVEITKENLDFETVK